MHISSMLSLTRSMESAYSSACQPVINRFRISKTSFDILMFLANNPEHFTANEVSSMRNIKPNVVSLHVEKLVHDGYLERCHVEGDRRKIRLICTEKAVPIIEEGHAVQRTFYASMMSGLSEEDLQRFLHVIHVVTENVNAFQNKNK